MRALWLLIPSGFLFSRRRSPRVFALWDLVFPAVLAPAPDARGPGNTTSPLQFQKTPPYREPHPVGYPAHWEPTSYGPRSSPCTLRDTRHTGSHPHTRTFSRFQAPLPCRKLCKLGWSRPRDKLPLSLSWTFVRTSQYKTTSFGR